MQQDIEELESLADGTSILLLTETHQNSAMLLNDSWEVHESVRKLKDRKGGGLLIVHKRTRKIELKVKKSNSSDIQRPMDIYMELRLPSY